VNREDVKTCPKCGALISPNLPRCRQCKAYLHGTELEGFLLEHLLPARLAASPGTGIFMLIIMGYFALMVMFAGPLSALSLSTFSAAELGSTWSPGIFAGEYWRFVSSSLAHGGVVHIAFNLWALTIAGPVVEEAFDRKKMMLLFGISGILSMAVSYVVYVELLGHTIHQSVGASGAISGLIGGSFVVARRMGPAGRQIEHAMWRWTVFMLVFGFVAPGVDNAAHVGGWLIGAGMALVMPVGLTQTVAAQRALSVATFGLLGLVIASVALMLMHLKGFPASLENDAEPITILGMVVKPGAEWDYSDQVTSIRDCQDAFDAANESGTVTDAQLYSCELALRINPSPSIYRATAHLEEARGNTARADTLRRVAARLVHSPR